MVRFLPVPALLLVGVACLADESAPDTCETETGAGDTKPTPATPPPGLDLSAQITVCPVWSGIPDLFATGGAFEGTYSGPYPDRTGTAKTQTMGWWRFGGASGGEEDGRGREESTSTYTLNAEGASYTTVQSNNLAFSCDGSGLWLIESDSEYRGIDGVGSYEPVSLYHYVACGDEPMLLIPRELDLGKTWSTSCSGGLISGNHYESPWSCNLNFEVAEMSTYSTPAGSWEAARIRLVRDPESTCDGYLPYIAFFAAEDGFWVGKGIGRLAYSDPHGYRMTRTSAQ